MHTTTTVSHSYDIKIVFDACSLINIVNGEVLPKILSLPAHFYCIGSIVEGESRSIKDALEQYLKSGAIAIIDPSSISGTAYIANLESYHLGPGETECITFAQSLGFTICTDDGKARNTIIETLGKDRLRGTISLMNECVDLGLLSSGSANFSYQKMLAMGAFLPKDYVFAAKEVRA